MKYQPPKGTRDFIGDEFYIRQNIIQEILKVTEKYGFRQVMTPMFEPLDLLAKDAGEEVISQIYKITDKNNRIFGLKSDITPPLARLISNYSKNIPKPIKFSCFDRVYRYEKPQKGRYREIYQVNAEMFGVRSAAADAELLACLYDCYKAIGLKEILIKIGYRPLLDLFVKSVVGSERSKKIIQLIDKKDKLEKSEILSEMVNIGLKTKQIEKIMQFSKIQGDFSTISKKLKSVLPDSINIEAYLNNLGDIWTTLNNYNIDDRCLINLSLARGSEYYTGIIFEVRFPEYENISIGGGGRYDNLVEFYGGVSTPAVGFSIGIDRVYNLLEDLKRLPSSSKQIDYYIASEANRKSLMTARKMATKLRDRGFSVELPLINSYLSEQLASAKKMKVKKILLIKQQMLKGNLAKLIDSETQNEKMVKLNI